MNDIESILGAKQYEMGITLHDFRRMVASLKPKELACIPIELLPDSIPDDIIEVAPENTKSVLEDILFELNTREINLRLELEETFSVEVADAYNLSKLTADTPIQEAFRLKISDLLMHYKKWEKTQDSAERASMLPKIKDLDHVVGQLRADNMAFIKAKSVLEKVINNTIDHQKRFDKAIKILTNKAENVELGLGRYFYLRLAVVGGEMRRLEERIHDSGSQVSEIQNKIDNIHAQLSETKSSLFALDKAREQIRDSLKEDINNLMDQKRAIEVMISETDLTGWLDVIVDAAITPQGNVNVQTLLKRARMSLYNLLQQYCQRQEEAALQVAKNPFTQADPKGTIKFMLQSEQFILDYFTTKKNQLVNWLGDAADTKIEQLGNIERELLRELKKNNKLRK